MRRIHGFLFILLLTSLLPPMTLAAANIVTTVYELEDYVRHPRMEEEDRLRGGNPSFRPGLEIITDVEEVQIEFFEEQVGRTPMEWDNLSAGAYRVRLERTGYEIIEFWVEVFRDRRTVVYVEMGEPAGELLLRNLPGGATVTLDRNPLEIDSEGVSTAPAGLRSLRVRAFGWIDVVETINIPPGGSLEWTFEGERSVFAFSDLKIRPANLPAGDRRGFRIDWKASGPGSADVRILTDTGDRITIIPFGISTVSGTVYWKPTFPSGEPLPEGEYGVTLTGTGYDNTRTSRSGELVVDNRFRREARPSAFLLPGLIYAPGAALLPPGIWQASTGLAWVIDSSGSSEYSGIPAGFGFRISPGKRWELSGKFGMKARDPFDTTSLSFSLSGAWRMNPGSSPFEANLSLLYYHEGYAVRFASIPKSSGMALPGLQLTVPMEYSFGSLSVVVSPAMNLFFTGTDPDSWELGGPARFTGSLGTGIYWENGRFLAGASTALRSPDVSGDFLDWAMWSGLEGRFDLPGEASYFALWAGVRYLDIQPVVNLGLEFGVIR